MSRPSRRDSLVGQVIAGRYVVVSEIASGGMGTIYEAMHQRLSRGFAIKVLARSMTGNEEALARFHREADVIARLRHPNIVDSVDVDKTHDGAPCIVMELLVGEDLGALLARSVYLPWPDIARYADEVLCALEAAHRAGVMHRDLKPKNIFLSRDDLGDVRAKLLDFGVSKIAHGRTVVTTDTALLGTPSYMSPEQADGRRDDIGPASDLWAVGAILYEMATGRRAFDASSVPSILYRICHKDPEPLAALRPDAPGAFVDVVNGALTREPARRIGTARAFRQQLREALMPVVGASAFGRMPTAPGAIFEPAPERAEPSVEVRVEAAQASAARGQASEPPGHATTTLLATSVTARPRRERARRVATIGAVAAATLIGAATLRAVTRGDSETVADIAAAGPAASARELDAEPVGAAASRALDAGTAPLAAANPADAAPARVRVEITSTPPGAAVLAAGTREPVCVTPCGLDVDRGGDAKTFVVARRGFRKAQIELVPDRDHERHVELRRARRRPPRNGGGRRGDGRSNTSGDQLGNETINPFD